MSTASTTSTGLLQAIIANHADDAVRLVYADVIADQGGPDGGYANEARAEFIHVQVELAKRPRTRQCYHDNDDVADREGYLGCAGCNEWSITRALRRRERELLKANFGAWTDFLPECLVTKECPWCVDQVADYETNVIECRQCECTGLVPDEDNVVFHRGFVAEVHCRLVDWIGEECSACRWPGVEIREGFDAVNAVIQWGRLKKICPTCHGAGHVGRHGPALVRAAPIERVRTDKTPAQAYGRWCWFHGLDNRADVIPRELWTLLSADRVPNDGLLVDADAKGYKSKESAMGAFSTTLIAWAKAQPVR